MILVAVASAACPALGPLLDQLRTDLEDVRLDATTTDLEAAQATLACGPVVEPEEAARLHALSGVRSTLLGQADTAKAAFTTARLLDPTLDLSAFGPSLAGAFATAQPERPVRFEIRPATGSSRQAWVDGRPAEASLAPGAHVVQVTEGDRTLFGTRVVAFPGQALVLETGLSEPAVPAPEPQAVAVAPVPVPRGEIGGPRQIPGPPVDPPDRARSRLPFVGAVVAAAGAGLLAYSAERAAALETAPDAATLERRWAAHKATRASGAGVVVVGLGVLLVGAF